MIDLKFPDGQRRQFRGRRHRPRRRRGDLAVPGQESPAGQARRRAARSRPAAGARRRYRDRHPRQPRGPGGDPPRHRPRPGRGGAGAVSRHPGDHRPQCRGRLLLRLRPRRALLPGRSGPDRGAHAQDRRSRRADHARGLGPRRGHRPFRRHRRGLQGADHPRHSRRPGRSRSIARETGRTSAADRTCPPRAMWARRSS